MTVIIFEGNLVARKTNDPAEQGAMQVQVINAYASQDFASIEGKRVRVTVEVIGENETFEHVAGVPELENENNDENQ